MAEPGIVARTDFKRDVTIQVTEAMANKLKTVPLKFSLALGKLPAGRYNCQVTVIDPSTQKAAFWQTPVMLVQ